MKISLTENSIKRPKHSKPWQIGNPETLGGGEREIQLFFFERENWEGKAMDAIRKQLDVLMGANRNGDVREVNRKYYDRDVCRLFLVGLCPHELFQLTVMFCKYPPLPWSVRLFSLALPVLVLMEVWQSGVNEISTSHIVVWFRLTWHRGLETKGHIFLRLVHSGNRENSVKWKPRI